MANIAEPNAVEVEYIIDQKYGVTHIDGELWIVNRQTNKVIPEMEPMFLFRASDPFAVPVLGYYYRLCKNAEREQSHLDGILAAAKAFEGYQDEVARQIRKSQKENQKETNKSK